MAPSCIISEIKRDSGRKSRFFKIPNLHSTPSLGGRRLNIAIRLGTGKLEWCMATRRWKSLIARLAIKSKILSLQAKTVTINYKVPINISRDWVSLQNDVPHPYCDNFLEEGLLRDIRRISKDFVFQQDGALAHCITSHDTVGDRPTAIKRLAMVMAVMNDVSTDQWYFSNGI